MDKHGSGEVIQEFITPKKFDSKQSPQWLAGLVATIGALSAGTMLGFSSPAIPNLEEREDFPVTDDDKTWIGSSAMLGALTAGLLAGFCIDVVGRKLTMMGLGVMLIIGFIIIALSKGLMMMIAGRFISGFGGGMCLAVPVYISEIAVPEIRGKLGNCMCLILVTGILVVYCIGSLASWVVTSWICVSFPIIFLITIFFMPESPTYLLMKNKRFEASKSLQFLRGASSEKEIEPELEALEETVNESLAQKGSVKDLFKLQVAKPVGISMMLMFLQQYGGINIVLFYSVEVFKSAGTDIDANVSSIVIGAVQVAFVFVSIILVDRAGRKILMVVSETGMAISLVVLGVFFYLKKQNNDVAPEGLGWLPLLALILYIIFYSIGLGPLPWLMMSEVVPSYVKGPASAFCTALCWLLAFVVTKTFADMESVLGTHGCYWLFGGISAGGALFSLFILPETKGKSLAEIQRLFEP